MFNGPASQTGLSYHKLRKPFSNLYRRHFEFISKVGLRRFYVKGLSEAKFYGDLVNKFKKLIGRNHFSFQFSLIIIR